MPYKDEEKRKGYNKMYYENFIDKEEHKNKYREYYQKNKDRISARKKEYYQRNKENINGKVKEYQRQNKDSVKKRSADYYQRNKEQCKEWSRNWYENNKDRHKENNKRNHTNANNKSKLTAHNYNRTWSFEEKEILLILKADGVPSSQIAMLLGRTIRSVENMAHKIKTKGALDTNVSNKQNSEAMDELMDLIVAYCLVSKE
ncbi:MAG: hypothetical protein IJ889_01000 [Eubacterium sp.]|nr:hypothetical protein [Eubacterium sp.]MBR2247358.1 hypothetical protein [Bacilli bacterium]